MGMARTVLRTTPMRDLTLSGGDISLIKCFGTGTAGVKGADLAKACGMVEAEFVDTLKGLIMLGLVSSSKPQFNSASEIASVAFQLNSGRLKEIRTAIRPKAKKGGR